MVLVGERKDSQTYVNAKKKACAEAGIDSFGTDLPGDATEEEVLKVVADYNADPNVHGILVQLPMPDHIDEERRGRAPRRCGRASGAAPGCRARSGRRCSRRPP